MIGLVSLEQAKDRLNIDDGNTDKDADIQSIISQASAILLRRIKKTESTLYSDWGSPIEVPEDLQAVTLEMVSEMYKNREASAADILSDRLLMLLEPHRTPTIA